MRKIILILLVISGTALIAESAEHFTPYNGEQLLPDEGLNPTFWLPQIPDHGYYHENYFLILAGDRGHWFIINVTFSHISMKGTLAGFETSYREPGKQTRFFKSCYPIEELQIDADCPSIRVRDQMLSAEPPQYKIHTQYETFQLEATITSDYPSFRIRNGRIRFDDSGKKFFDHSIHVPRGRFEGVLKDGTIQEKVSGYAYLDHSRQTIVGSKFSRRWYSLRCFHPQIALGMMDIITTDRYGGKRIPSLFLGSQDGIRLVTENHVLTPTQPVTDEECGYRIPQQFALDLEGEDITLSCRYGNLPMIDRFDVVHHLNAMERFLLKTFFARPVFYRYAGAITLDLTLDGIRQSVDTLGIYEVVHVR